jgi:hypothetical protein
VAGDSKEQRNPAFVEVAVYFGAQSPEEINLSCRMIVGPTVLIVNMPLDAVKQKRQQVKQAKELVRIFLPVPVGNFVSTLCSRLYPWFLNTLQKVHARFTYLFAYRMAAI